MSERAHPDDPGFQDRWEFRLRRGFIPWLCFRRSPYRAAFFWRYEWASRYCRGKDVLDVPCGMGWGTSLIKNPRSIVGVDISADSVAEARQRYGQVGTFYQGDMANLAFDDESFDVVVCLEGIEHVSLEIGKRFLKECKRVLRPGGKLLLSSPCCRTMRHSGNPYHVHEYTPDEIQALVSQDFEIKELVTRDVDIMRVLYLCCDVRKP